MKNSIIVCYPGGAGGCFISTALRTAIYGTEFAFDRDHGHCHRGRTPRELYVSGDSIKSFKGELKSIERIDFSSQYNVTVEGHFRNIIALQDRCVQNNVHSLFVKIDVDVNNEAEIEFVTRMLVAKQSLEECLKKGYQEIRGPTWPATYDEYIANDPAGTLFIESGMASVRSWYWVENNFTKTRTVTLTLQDVFIGGAGDKLKSWLTPESTEKFNQLHREYVTVNQQVYSHLYKLLF
jgi:hypothetical protein